MTAPRVLDCLAGQWVEWRDLMAANGLPDEVIESFVRPVFYSGALSVMALLAEGRGRNDDQGGAGAVRDGEPGL